MSLDLNTVTGPGRRAAPVTAEVVRELNEADVALLSLAPEEPSTPKPLERISQRHHSAARLIASGIPMGEVAAALGYTAARLSVLKNSPAFVELIDLYKREVDIQFSTTLERLSTVSADALDEIQNRLEETPEEFTLRDLRETAQLGLNRTGYGESKTIEQNVNVNMAERLEAARQRARAASQGQIIDAEVIDP